MKLLQPKNWDEWLGEFVNLQDDLDRLEIVEPIHMESGQVLMRHELEEAVTKTEEAFRDWAVIKDLANQLLTIAHRWYDQEFARLTLEACVDAENFPNQEAQKAHAKVGAKNARENYEACKVLMAAVHDERSRLYEYRETLINLLHGVRQEEKMARGN